MGSPRRVSSAIVAVILALPLAALGSPSATAVVPGSLGAAAASSWQSNATVWKMAYAHGDIWLVGDFTSLRPPGDPKGVGTRPANHFAALKAATGAPDTAVDMRHVFADASGAPVALTKATVAASPDGKTIYVGGEFSYVDGQLRDNLAAFKASNGALLPWSPDVSGRVSAIATAGSTVYIGGTFGEVNHTAVGPNLAAIDASSGALLPWGSGVQPSTGDTVVALATTPGGAQVIAGGYFDTVDGRSRSADGRTTYNKAVIIGGIGSSQAGRLEPMTADSVVPPGTDQDNDGCTSDVKDIVVSGSRAYLANEGTGGGCFDGTWAVNLPGGTLSWVSRCLGGTQTVAVVGSYLYKGSHTHDCQSQNRNGDPDNFPDVSAGQSRHLLSERVSNGFLGPWAPFTNAGPNLGPRTMATDGRQLYVGGDFTIVNHVGQQGIVRFTPTSDYPPPRPAAPSLGRNRAGKVTVTATAPVDLDDPHLTMQLFRNRGTTPVARAKVTSLFWKQPTVHLTDRHAPAGRRVTYRVRAVETDGAHKSRFSPSSRRITVR